MATPTGTISFNDLRTETGITGAISLGDGKVQDLIGRTSNVDMATAKNKTSSFQFNISSSTSARFITGLGVAAGWQGTGDLIAVIPSGTVTSLIYAESGYWGNLTILNQGSIVGAGGNAGRGNSGTTNSGTFNTIVDISYNTGNAGGDALYVYGPAFNRVQRLIILNNTGVIYGGGGGGGGGDAIAAGYGAGDVDFVGGGGGGGGAGVVAGLGGPGGTALVINGGGTAVNGNAGSAGGSGLSGSTGGGGGGTAGAHPRFGQYVGGTGGTGGNPGAGGAAGGANTVNWGYQGSGGAAGYAIRGYSNLTVVSLGTTLGTLG